MPPSEPITGEALPAERPSRCDRCDRDTPRAELRGFDEDGAPAAELERVRWWLCPPCHRDSNTPPAPPPGERRWRLAMTLPWGSVYTLPVVGDETHAMKTARILREEMARSSGGAFLVDITRGRFAALEDPTGALVELRRPDGRVARRWLRVLGDWKVTA